MLHLDLFSGIGGFAYAADQIWDDVEHIFCDNDKFCRRILNKHYPESEIYKDVRHITNTNFKRSLERKAEIKPTERYAAQPRSAQCVDLLTGGFPCQPFSQAGLRRGTADDRHLWPEMFRIIQLTKPAWVIAENVRGILTWNEGLVFEQVCTDLETAGYDVQPFIIPAAAVNAPHRRDRIWFVAHRRSTSQRPELFKGPTGNDRPIFGDKNSLAANAPNTVRRTGQFRQPKEALRPSGDDKFARSSWQRSWPEVAAEFCRMDDGLPARMDGLSATQHRIQRLKALGNAIVPQVAIEIMKAIKQAQGVNNE